MQTIDIAITFKYDRKAKCEGKSLKKGASEMEKISAIGQSWDEIKGELFTAEEIVASDLRVELIGEELEQNYLRQSLAIVKKLC